MNVLDELSRRGADRWLEQTRQVPMPAAAADNGMAWDDVVAEHLALLDHYPVLHEAYLDDPEALTQYGLPLSVKDYGSFISVRLQRATLQLWLVDQPWAAAGQVVVGNAGDLAKEARLVATGRAGTGAAPAAVETSQQ